MEHTHFKVVDYTDGESDNTGFEEFEELTISLLKYVREAIILLNFTVHQEELKKELSRDTNNIFLPLDTHTYEDEWKMIF